MKPVLRRALAGLLGRDIDAARYAEYRRLEHPAEEFDGRVWACEKWIWGCDTRIIEQPPYAERPPSDLCGTHGLAMTTKTAERRTINAEQEAAR